MDIDTEGVISLDINAFIGKSAALLGITGSGKTNTAAVLIEEVIAHGLPLTIVDIEGEYWGLKERFEVLVAGRSEHTELLLNPENAGTLARVSIERGISIILDLSDYTEEESYTCLTEYFMALWEAASKAKRPYQIVLEEAHEWIPEGVRTPLKSLLTRIALRGRKRGLSIMLMSQRSAKVAKDVLTQTSLLFLHKVVHPTDMKVYKDLIPLPSAEVESTVSTLHPGQVVVVSNHTPQVVHIRLRHTFHAGSTPAFGEQIQPELRKIDEEMLRELQQTMTASSPVAKDEKRFEKRIKELEALLIEKDKEIAERDKQIVLLSKLSITMNGTGPVIQTPEIMQISHAHIDAATIHRVYPSSDNPVIIDATPQQQLPTPIPVNEAKVRSLQQRLARLSPKQHRIFTLLVERNVPMTIDEIAAWMNTSKSTIQRNLPPDALFKMGLLKRSQRGNAHVYRSTVREHLTKEFPGANQDALIQRMLHP